MAISDSIPSSIEQYLDAQLRAYFSAHRDDLPATGLYERLLPHLERPLIEQTLQATSGNQIKAAEILGLNRNTLRKKIRLLGIATKPRRMQRRPERSLKHAQPRRLTPQATAQRAPRAATPRMEPQA